jgi:hypothetical protein
MTQSTPQTNGNSVVLTFLRRSHRWLGISTALFLLVLSVTGIAINHANDWRLDTRFVGWDWVLDAYGIVAPEPAASFTDGDHRATQLGSRLYLDHVLVPREIDTLTGLVMLDATLVVASTRFEVLLLTTDGEFIDAVDLAGTLRAPISQLGRADGRAVVASDERILIADLDLASFGNWDEAGQADIHWSATATVPAAERQMLQRFYRGEGLTLERVLLDIHSGRILPVLGKALLDVIAVAVIVLCISGLLLWGRRGNRRNGNGNGNGG